MTRRMLVAGMCVISAVACGKSPQQQAADKAAKSMQDGAQAMQQGAQQMAQAAQQAAPQVAQGSQQMAQGLQQMAQGFQQMAQANGAATKPVDYEQLKGLVPDIDGWTKGEVKGEELSMPVAYSRAEANYEKGDSHIQLEITDSAMSQMLLAPMSIFLGSGYSERSDDGFKRAAKIGGQPGLQDWNAKSKHGEVTAVVGTRFIVHATGNDVDQIDPVEKVVESVNFGKLAALK